MRIFRSFTPRTDPGTPRTDASTPRTETGTAGLGRISGGISIAAVLVHVYITRSAAGDSNPFDYFGYFTNLTTLLTSIVLICTGAVMITGRRVPAWLTSDSLADGGSHPRAHRRLGSLRLPAP
jgi:hypothetical protein